MESDQLSGYPLSRWTLTLKGRQIDVVGPANEEELLDRPDVQRRFEEDEYLPYWGQLWPAAVMLAEHVLADGPGRGRLAVEIGCGLGLPAVAAGLAGWEVLATDYDEDALEFARENARLNHVASVRTKLLDWRSPDLAGRFDRLIASDVLYERRHHRPVADFIVRFLADDGMALVVDPNRKQANDFEDILRHVGLTWETAATHANQPYGRYVKGTIYRIWR